MERHDIIKAAKIANILLCAMLAGSCSAFADELPDSYFETDNVASAVTTASSSETTSVSTPRTQENIVSLETTAEIYKNTVTAAECTFETAVSRTNVPETTISETTVPETISEITAFETAVITSEETAFTEEIAASETASQTTRTETTTGAAASENTTAAPESAGTYYPRNSYYALNFDRQNAVWISYLEYDRIMKNADEASFTSSLGECFDNIAALGCNTVYFQVRAYGDAYYDSSLFPKGDRLTGDYDPLKIAVKLAHDRGLSIHAWINPMRLMTDSQMSGLGTDCVIGKWYNDSSKKGTYIVESSGRWYLSPAYSDTISLICDGIREILTGYDVDGIQIDDYFYPTTDESFDREAYSASGTALALGDWRRETVTKMVKQLYLTVHGANPTAVFGISPQGNMSSDFDTLYADIYTWCGSSGYCDYICPQIYYGFENSTLPYAETVDSWAKLTGDNISLVIGLAAYKSGTEDTYAGDGKNEWLNSSDILSRQRDLTEIYSAGYAFFRYDSLFEPAQSVSAHVNKELENLY